MAGRLTSIFGAVIVVAFSSLVVSVGGQQPSSQAKATKPSPGPGAAYRVPRTPWGDPDLQGTWNNGTITPLERPREAGEKELLSAQEVDEANTQSDTRAASENRPKDKDADLALAYNQEWWDRGQSIGRTSLIVDPQSGRLPELTAAGRQMLDRRAAERRGRGEADSWTDRPLQERCILYHGVPPLPTGYNNNYEITQAPGIVAILHEEIHEVRLIPLDGRPHAGRAITQWLGDSRGRWEGDTLVVETTNFRQDATFRFPADPSTLTIVERFRRTGPNDIDYQFTVHNPSMYSSSWTATLPMRSESGMIFEYACHEGNYALEHVLQGHRAEEQREIERGKK
jgi:hypothetical protein